MRKEADLKLFLAAMVAGTGELLLVEGRRQPCRAELESWASPLVATWVRHRGAGTHLAAPCVQSCLHTSACNCCAWRTFSFWRFLEQHMCIFVSAPLAAFHLDPSSTSLPTHTDTCLRTHRTGRGGRQGL
eukprot:1161469-Pelagomonas_calceolata.AAC.53